MGLFKEARAGGGVGGLIYFRTRIQSGKAHVHEVLGHTAENLKQMLINFLPLKGRGGLFERGGA